MALSEQHGGGGLRRKYDIMMFFAALSFAKEADSQIMQTLLCFALSPGTRPRQLSH